MTTFKVGDKVKIEGILEENTGGSTSYLLKLRVGEGLMLTFTEDGRYYKSHREPTLTMVEPAPVPLKVGQVWIDLAGTQQVIFEITDDIVRYNRRILGHDWVVREDNIQTFSKYAGTLKED